MGLEVGTRGTGVGEKVWTEWGGAGRGKRERVGVRGGERKQEPGRDVGPFGNPGRFFSILDPKTGPLKPTTGTLDPEEGSRTPVSPNLRLGKVQKKVGRDVVPEVGISCRCWCVRGSRWVFVHPGVLPSKLRWGAPLNLR